MSAPQQLNLGATAVEWDSDSADRSVNFHATGTAAISLSSSGTGQPVYRLGPGEEVTLPAPQGSRYFALGSGTLVATPSPLSVAGALYPRNVTGEGLIFRSAGYRAPFLPLTIEVQHAGYLVIAYSDLNPTTPAFPYLYATSPLAFDDGMVNRGWALQNADTGVIQIEPYLGAGVFFFPVVPGSYTLKGYGMFNTPPFPFRWIAPGAVTVSLSTARPSLPGFAMISQPTRAISTSVHIGHAVKARFSWKKSANTATLAVVEYGYFADSSNTLPDGSTGPTIEIVTLKTTNGSAAASGTVDIEPVGTIATVSTDAPTGSDSVALVASFEQAR